MTRPRLRDLGITLGRLSTGPYNTITDVPDVRVGHVTIIHDDPRVARTGVTVIAAREGPTAQDHAFAGYHSLNGCGEMTGLLWLEESGRLSSEIALTSTFSVGTVHQALVVHATENGHGGYLPVVAETFDGFLNDGPGFHVTEDHVQQAIEAASSGPVVEGNVGGGTGMMCHEFKGGIGTASRVAETPSGAYTVGALVQANHGERTDLRVDGVPVGQLIGPDHTPLPGYSAQEAGSSIVVVLATDAPLLPYQCERLAQRAAIGLGRTGSYGHNWSGDIFLAFATANHLPPRSEAPDAVMTLPNQHMNALFLAAAEAVEEAIINALCAAETMIGQQGHTAYALPLEEFQRVMTECRQLQHE
jgi:D-aminopeptidase